jgi:RNA polymerase sigma-70 factor, ECF subfamily
MAVSRVFWRRARSAGLAGGGRRGGRPGFPCERVRRLLRGHGASHHAQLILLTGDRLEAEDVTQEAFERAWLRWSTVRDSSSAEAWVRTVAQRLAISRWRRVRNAAVAWRRHGPAPNLPELDEQHVALMSALGRLPLQQRRAVVLYHLVDLPVDEVAAETGSSVAAVKKQLERGRAALADLLDDNDAESSQVRTVQP